MEPYAFRIREPLPVNGRRAKRALLDPDDELLTIEGVAERCKVNAAFIRKAIDERELRVVVLGPNTRRITAQ